jgi:hypothetical protein
MPAIPDRFDVDLDRPDLAAQAAASAPGAQHVAIWFSGRDLFAARAGIVEAVAARIRVDPHARLDVVLRSSQAFPLDVVDALQALFERSPQSYLSRSQALRGEDAQRRVTVVVPRGSSPPADWIEGARDATDVYEEQTAAEAVARAEDLGDARPAALVIGDLAAEEQEGLRERADPHAVAFDSRVLEARWTRDA